MAVRLCTRVALSSARAFTVSNPALLSIHQPCTFVPARQKAFRYVDVPKPGGGTQYRYRVDLPEKYTMTKLPIQKLAGRDPVTGRVVVGTLGGGSKQKYRMVDHVMRPLADGSPRVEVVLNLVYDPLRTCRVAVVGHGDKLRYVIAHEEMKAGDVVTTYGDIPAMPVRPKIGDSHPLGALPAGTIVFNIEMYYGEEQRMCIAGGTYATVLRRVGDMVVLQMPSKRQFSFRQECMCVIGRVSMKVPAIRPIGSAQRLRHLGYRPRSGLYQKKTGRFGRKVRPIPPLKNYLQPPMTKPPPLTLTVRDKNVPGNNFGKMFPDYERRNQTPWS